MYPYIFKNLINPFYETVIKRRKMLDYRRFLEESQWWPAEKLRNYQREELKRLLKHAYEQCRFYRETFEKLDLTPEAVNKYEAFRRLPIIEKADIRARKEDMIAGNWRGKTWTKSTGGSTGVPLELDYTPESYDWRVAAWKRGYAWAGCEDGMRQVWIYGGDVGSPSAFSQWKKRLHERIYGRVTFDCFYLTEERMRECLNFIRRYRPRVIVGYTNSLYDFAKFVKTSGGLGFKLQSVITAAEKLHEFQRQDMEEVFQCGVYHTYGCREFMLIAMECPERSQMHLTSENLFVEIIKEDGTPAGPGEIGDVVITDLHNYGMPFIRYRIGDMAVASDHVCPCGRGLPMIRDVTGRTADLIKALDGKAVSGVFFPHLMKELKSVERFQVIQNRIDELEIKIVKTPEWGDSDMKFLDGEVRKVMGNEVQINYDFVPDIPLTPTGKYRVTVSNLKE